jgi:hypothetical protein
MGTVASDKPETVGYIERAGERIRLVEHHVERAVNQRTRSLGDVIAAVALVLLGIWIGGRR